MHFFKKSPHIPGKASRLILRLELPVVLIFLIAVVVTYLKAQAIDPLGARFECLAMLETIFSGLVIVTLSAFLADALEYDRNHRNNKE